MVQAAPMAQRFRVGEWLVEPALDCISRGQQRVKLEPRVMQILVVLARQPGVVVSVNELLDSVWGHVIVSPESVYQYVAQLRKALGDSSEDPQYIATVPRKGYRLIARVVDDDARGTAPEQLPRADPGEVAAQVRPVARTEIAPAASAPQRSTVSRVMRIAIGLGVVLVAAALWLAPQAWRDRWRGAPVERSIVVLPFDDLSAEGSNAAFCDGLAEEVMNSLGEIPGLRVIARTSAFALRGRSIDVRAIGHELDVTHIVEGSVRPTGASARIAAQLVDASDGHRLWSMSTDRRLDDVLGLQQQIANAVATALKLQLSAEASVRLSRRATANPLAYEQYLLGRYAQYERTGASAARAIEHQQRAITLDPDFALAHVGLADAYIAQYNFGDLPQQALIENATPPIERALALDPLLSDAYATRGSLNTQRWALAEAQADLRRALVLNPNSSRAHLGLGIALDYAGSPRRALESYRAAAALDPLDYFVAQRECLTLQMLGRYTEAPARCDRAIELEPAHPNAYWVHGLIAAAQGKIDEALPWYQGALDRGVSLAIAPQQAAWLRRDLHEADAARALIERAIAANPPAGEAQRIEEARLMWADGYKAESAVLVRTFALDTSALPEVRITALMFRRALEGEATAITSDAEVMRLVEHPADLQNVFDLQWGWAPSINLAWLAAQEGRPDIARKLLDGLEAELERLESNGLVANGFAYLRASVAAQRGRTAEALAALKRAYAQGWHRTWWARIDPTLAPLRPDPRFEALLKRADGDSAAMSERLRRASTTRAAGS